MGRITEVVSELRERRIVRILLSYLAIGWVVVEAADQLEQQELLPNIAYRLVLLWFLAGIVVCLILGWYHGEKGAQKVSALEFGLLGMWAVGVIFISGLTISREMSDPLLAAAGGADLRRVGVLYFADLTPGGENQPLADGFTEDLIAELSTVRDLDVISRNGVAPFRGSDVAPDSIAKALHAGTLVGGSVEAVGDKLRIMVRLLDGPSGTEFKRRGFELPAAAVLAARDSIVGETSRLLREWLGEEIQLRQVRAGTENTAAWALVQRAERELKQAADLQRHDDPAGVSFAFDRADELLAQAQQVDTAWVRPAVLRGEIGYRRSRAAHEPYEAVRWIKEGLGHAESALRLEPNYAPALTLRGVLNYWHYLLNVTPDPAERQRLLMSAKEDLEQAVALDPGEASAHSALGHLYYQLDDPSSALIANRRAYEEDAYLDVADVILWRLFSGSYDVQQFTQAERWCGEGGVRFPEDSRFVECQLWLLTTPAKEPDVQRAWQLLARLDTVAPDARREFEQVRGRLLVGGVLGRAQLPDSAAAVFAYAHDQLTGNPEYLDALLLTEAHMRTIAGDQDGAIDVLKRYSAMTPGATFDHNWWWNPLRSNPRFAEL